MFPDATATAASIAQGRLSCGRVLTEHLIRLAAWNPQVNAVVTIDEPGARRAASVLEDVPPSISFPLRGIPITVKDTLEVSGIRTAAGSAELLNHVPATDAAAVARLRQAGCLVVGKTNVPKLASDMQTFNEPFGLTVNPWDHNRSPGGSSGGSAASVALGFASLEVASDHAGSLTLPAHYCGVAAHKPTYGLVPAVGHIPPGPANPHQRRDLMVVGPMARTVRDLRVAMSVLAGPGSMAGAASNADEGLARRPHRIALWSEHPSAPTSVTVSKHVRGVAGELAAGGVEVEEEMPDPDILRTAFDVAVQLFSAAASPGYSDERFGGVVEFASAIPGENTDLLSMMARSVAMRHRDWLRLDEERHRLIFELERWMAPYEAVLAPVSTITAFPHDLEGGRSARLEVDGEQRLAFEQIVWAATVSALYLPATVVPTGVAADGLPCGVQLIGRRGCDDETLLVGRVAEQVTGGYVAPPMATGIGK